MNPSPGHAWLEPPGFAGQASATAATDSDGLAIFRWTLHRDEPATLGITRVEGPGFHFLLARCQTHHANGDVIEHPAGRTVITGSTLTREQFHSCEVYNAEVVFDDAHVRVTKRPRPLFTG